MPIMFIHLCVCSSSNEFVNEMISLKHFSSIFNFNKPIDQKEKYWIFIRMNTLCWTNFFGFPIRITSASTSKINFFFHSEKCSRNSKSGKLKMKNWTFCFISLCDQLLRFKFNLKQYKSYLLSYLFIFSHFADKNTLTKPWNSFYGLLKL